MRLAPSLNSARNLFGQSSIVLGAMRVRSVLKDRLAKTGRFGQTDIAGDDRLKHLTGKVGTNFFRHILAEIAAGIVRAVGDPAQGIRRLFADPALRLNMGKTARQRVLGIGSFRIRVCFGFRASVFEFPRLCG